MIRRPNPSKIVFVDEKLKEAFDKLKNSSSEDKELYGWLSRAFEDLGKNAFCGTEIPKNLIPKDYMKLGITNLWKYDLPKAWRLIYSIGNQDITIISIILEWFDHKNYERRFGY